MDTNRIRYFLSLAGTGSVTQAAALHHISPAALSKAMRVFSIEMGHDILIPHGRGILLTDGARALVPMLRDVIDRLDAARDSLLASEATTHRAQKPLSIATFEVFSTYFLEHFLSTAWKDHACHVHEMIPGQMETAVANRVADLALTYIPIPHPELDFLKVAPIQMGIYGHPGHHQFQANIGPGDYGKLEFVVPCAPVEGSPNKVRGLDGWPDGAFPRIIRYRVQMLETALGLCRRRMAFAYIPRFIARLHNATVRPSLALQELRLPPNFTRQKDYCYLIKRKSDREGSGAKKLAAALRQACAER